MMRRWALLLVALVCRPALADSLSLISLLSDGNGGIIAFARDSRKVISVPVDGTGAAHPEQAVTVRADLPSSSWFAVFAIARTPAGYLTTFNDVGGIAWILPLRNDFSANATQRPLGSDIPSPLVCNEGVCALVRQVKRTLLLVDPDGTERAELPTNPNLVQLIGTTDGGFAVLEYQFPTQDSTVLAVELINRQGEVTTTSTVAKSSQRFTSAAIAPHPQGVAVFWSEQARVSAAIVRSDGTVVPRASFIAPDLEARVGAAAGGGRYALTLTTVVQQGVHAPSPINTPDIDAAYLMLLSDSLDIVAGPTKLAPNATSSETAAIVAGDDAFFVLFTSPTYRILRIPFAGPIDPSSSIPFQLSTAPRRRSVTR
jgi:hypothetical protein